MDDAYFNLFVSKTKPTTYRAEFSIPGRVIKSSDVFGNKPSQVVDSITARLAGYAGTVYLRSSNLDHAEIQQGKKNLRDLPEKDLQEIVNGLRKRNRSLEIVLG